MPEERGDLTVKRLRIKTMNLNVEERP